MLVIFDVGFDMYCVKVIVVVFGDVDYVVFVYGIGVIGVIC